MAETGIGPEQAQQQFAALLRSMKARTKRSYEELAKGIWVSSSALHRYCRGESLPADYGVVQRFAALCGATTEELRQLATLWGLANAVRQQERTRETIVKTAERVYAQFDAAEQRVARAILLRLITVGEANEHIFRQVRRAELLADLDTQAGNVVLDKLAAARLVTVDGDHVELSDESVVREWPTLRGWLADNHDTQNIPVNSMTNDDPVGSNPPRKSRLVVWLVAVIFLGFLTTAVVNLSKGNDTESADPPGAPMAQECIPEGEVIESNPELVTNDDSKLTSSQEGEVTRVRFSGYTWAGLFIQLPENLCNFRIDFDARLMSIANSFPGAGWGYGVGACNKWWAGLPTGFLLQYTFIDVAGREQSNSGRYSMPDVNNGRRVFLTPDYRNHHWSVSVEDGYFRASVDYGAPIGPFGLTQAAEPSTISGYAETLPKDCKNAGIFLRVVNSETVFSNIVVRSTGG